MVPDALSRFVDVQNQSYSKALAEVKNGKKDTHWMWFIFPQLKGLGRTETAKFYGLSGIDEANNYLTHPVLGKHLIQISKALLDLKGLSANEIFGTPDDLKLRSCMTLFANAPDADPVFQKILDKYYGGMRDELTLAILAKQASTSNM